MYKFISSVRLAIILIAALAGMAVSATLYNLPELFQSMPFRILVVAFFVNLLTCSVKLWPGVFRQLTHQPEKLIGTTDAFSYSELSSDAFEETLKKGRFHVVRYQTTEGTYIVARQKRLALLAPHILHIGLLVILVGAFFTTFETEGQLMLSPGEQQPLPKSISAQVGEGVIAVKDFETLYDENKAVENWVTTFNLSLNDKKVATDATTRVNHPYKKNGLSIYQMAYENVYLIHVESQNDRLNGDYAVPESQRFPLGKTTVDIEPMTENIALLYTFDNGKQSEGKALKIGKPVQVDDETKITYTEPLSATVLQFKYNRAMPIVFLGFILAGLGSVLFLLGRYSQIHAFIDEEGRVRIRIFNKSPYLRKRQFADFAIKQEKEGRRCI